MTDNKSFSDFWNKKLEQMEDFYNRDKNNDPYKENQEGYKSKSVKKKFTK